MNTPIKEETKVVRVVIPGNPYEEGSAAEDRVILRVIPVSELEENQKTNARRAAELTALEVIVTSINKFLQSEEVGPEIITFSGRTRVVDDPGKTGPAFIAASGPGIYQEWDNAQDALKWVHTQLPSLRERQTRANAWRAIVAAARTANWPTHQQVTTSGWIDHDESFGGLGGGDWETHTYQVRLPWTDRAETRILRGEDPATVCAEEIGRERAREDAARNTATRRAEIDEIITAGRAVDIWVGHNKNGHVWLNVTRGRDRRIVQIDKWDGGLYGNETSRRLPAIRQLIERRKTAKARLDRIQHLTNLRQCGLRPDEIAQVLTNPQNEPLLRELAYVRRNWRSLGGHYRRGRRGNLKFDAAIELRDRIWRAYERAVQLRTNREHAARQAAARQAAATNIQPISPATEPETTPASRVEQKTFGVGLADTFKKLGL